ncbi:TetR/AcrR family transcriptional regulator [Actinoallomurus soli]|uniref:TetR/AcrR family transcriptional regulator n=1 Tax=Actinoallomurus soli TaxID=2952535 RepID=UPI002092C5B2|nr:TetR/AcrR family transcriptional regulator [Actinoallomurus soli]MCO5968695.1 TetR/AcrR family transcriptional regulator [Actinoallomurus soli]
MDALTMRRLAAAAEVTPGALYKHFRDKRDLQRAMADAVYATIDLAGIDTDSPTVDQVITCCERLRAAMLGFRDGGRIVAGSYSPFAATATISATLRKLLEGLILPSLDAGDVAYALRNYTTGFVIEEQAYLTLLAGGEWDALVQSLPRQGGTEAGRSSDAVAILTGDRDLRFRAGLKVILTGTVA